VTESSELDVRDEHGAAHGAAHGPAQDAADRRDPHAEPSAEWGWHGTFPRTARIGGWFIAAVLLLMLIGNHSGRVEDLWLVALAAVVIGMLVSDQMKRRTAWRR
jgi:hypothetical protein